MSILLPCPFCGAQPTPTARAEGLVWCPNCSAGKTPEEWNRRAVMETRSLGDASTEAMRQAAHRLLDEMEAHRIKLQKFKEYVHGRLDGAGVPHDPDPAHNAEHGCRIEGRLNWVLERMKA